MKAKSIKGTTAEEIQLSLQQSINDNFHPTLAIVFVSVKQERSSCKSWMNCLRLQPVD
jgi:hypothetical protein